MAALQFFPLGLWIERTEWLDQRQRPSVPLGGVTRLMYIYRAVPLRRTISASNWS